MRQKRWNDGGLRTGWYNACRRIHPVLIPYLARRLGVPAVRVVTANDLVRELRRALEAARSNPIAGVSLMSENGQTFVRVCAILVA